MLLLLLKKPKKLKKLLSKLKKKQKKHTKKRWKKRPKLFPQDPMANSLWGFLLPEGAFQASAYMEASPLAAGYWLLVGYCTSSPMHAREALIKSFSKILMIFENDLISGSLKDMRTHEALFIF